MWKSPILGNPRKKILTESPRNPRKFGQGNAQETTEKLADYLVDRFQSPEFRPLFLKVAWRLDKGTIDRLVGTAFELGKNPRAYFICLVKKEPRYYQDTKQNSIGVQG